MFREKRIDRILNYILANKEVTVDELAQKYSVSTMTIRRDLSVLKNSELIGRTHGGAIATDFIMNEELYETKQTQNFDIKYKLAQKAGTLIPSSGGTSIFLDAGTTTYQVALVIKEHLQDLTIFTNDLKIAAELYPTSNDIYTVGGHVQRETGSIIGQQSNDFIKTLNIDICFIGVQSINDALFLLTPSEEKAINKQSIMNVSSIKVLICDKSKFHRKGLFNIASMKDFDYVVTNFEFPEEQFSLLAEYHTQIVSLL